MPLPSSVTWATRSLLPRLDVAGRHTSAQIYLHGAQLTAWQPVHARDPVLWMSAHSFFKPDKPIRGGVPICFPWFGPHREDKTVPAHGFGRLTPWTLCDARETPDGTVHLTLQLEDDNASPVWPHYFHADLRLSIGKTLTLALFVDNPITSRSLSKRRCTPTSPSATSTTSACRGWRTRVSRQGHRLPSASRFGADPVHR